MARHAIESATSARLRAGLGADTCRASSSNGTEPAQKRRWVQAMVSCAEAAFWCVVTQKAR